MGVYKGYRQTEEHKQHISEAILVFWSKPENKERMTQIRIKRPNTTNSSRGWHHSKTARENISRSMKRYWSRRKDKL